MRDPNKFTVEQLLRDDCQFVVPKYQRGYDWKGNTEVKDLFNDLEACIKARHHKDLFLGTMIFDVSNERKGFVEIIDGQQRLTTLVIILIACREYAKNELENSDFAHSTQQIICRTDPLLEEPRNQLIASRTILEVFNYICQKDWDGKFPDVVEVKGKKKQVKRQVARIRPIFNVAYAEIARLCEEKPSADFREVLRQIYKRTYVIKIEIEDRSEAFEIFERTNARGRGLEISDLLKNFLFSKSSEVAEFEVEEVWKRITENAGSGILRMLKYFWISRNGHISSRDLYRKIREHAQTIGISTFCQELEEFSIYYRAYYSDEQSELKSWLLNKRFDANDMYLNEFVRSASALKMFRITQVVPLLFAALNAFLDTPPAQRNVKTLLTLVRLLEFYHFANNKICDRVGNEVEKLYAEFSNKFAETDDFSITVGELKAKLLDQMVGREEFVGAFKNISYSNGTELNTIRYIFDMLVNLRVKDGQRKYLLDYNNVQKGVRGSFDIEHLLPRSLKKDDSEEFDYIDEVGNLMVIPKQINGILSNAEFKAKMDILVNPSNYSNNIKHVDDYLKEFAVAHHDVDDWGKDKISKRTSKLATEVFTIVSQNYSYK